MQESQFTTTSYIYMLLFVFFIILTYFILRKSRNKINGSFAFTTFLFALNSIGNIVNQSNIQIDETTTFVLVLFVGITATLGPLGIMSSAFIIHKGNFFWKNQKYLITLIIYLTFEIIAWSVELTQIQIELLTPNITLAMENGFILLPLIVSLIYYIPVLSMIPDQKNKVRTMLLGLMLAIIGQTINAIWNVLNNSSSLVGLAVVLIGVVVATISFTNFFDRLSESDQKNPI